jgi:hypothetical protein
VVVNGYPAFYSFLLIFSIGSDIIQCVYERIVRYEATVP